MTILTGPEIQWESTSRAMNPRWMNTIKCKKVSCWGGATFLFLSCLYVNIKLYKSTHSVLIYVYIKSTSFCDIFCNWFTYLHYISATNRIHIILGYSNMFFFLFKSCTEYEIFMCRSFHKMLRFKLYKKNDVRQI